MYRVIWGLVLTGLIFASCSEHSSNEIKGKPIQLKAPVQVNWVGHWKNEGFKEKLVYDMKRQFEFENEDIVLNLKFSQEVYPAGQSESQYNYTILQQEKPVWDIIRVNNEVSVLADLTKDPTWPAKYLVDFSQFEQFRNNSIDAVNSDEMKRRWGGIVPGHALDAHSFVLWCNKDLAEKLGIKIKQFNITADDFEEYLRLLNDYNIKNNKHIYAIPFTGGWSPATTFAWQLFASLIGNYDQLRDNQYSEDKINAWEQVLQYCERLSKYHPVDPNWRNYQYGTDYAKPLKGDCLFMVNGTWMFNIWQQMDSVNYRKMIPLELPALKPAQTYLGEVSIPWAVLKNAPHKEEAIRFMLYWCRPDVADEWVKNTKSPTGIKGNLVQTEFGFDVYETFDYTIAKKYGSKKIPYNFYNNAFFFGEKNASVPNCFAEVMEGSITAGEAMKKIRKQLIKR